MRFAEEASVRITPDALLRFDHVNREPDQVIAQNAGPPVSGWVWTQLLQRVDDQRRRVRPPPVQRALTGARTLGDALEAKPSESDLGELGDNRVRDRLLDRDSPPPPANWPLHSRGDGAGRAWHDSSICRTRISRAVRGRAG
jgi:hypothetical protein